MDKDTLNKLKPYLRNFIESYGEEAKGGGYVCPHCGSGRNKDSAFTIYDESTRYYCHACEKGGDVLDLAQEVKGCDKKEAIAFLASQYLGTFSPTPKAKPQKPKAQTNPKDLEAFREAYEGSEGAGYMISRGISTETAKAHGLGYDAKRKRVIIPSANGSYIARSITGASPKVLASGARELFNASALVGGGSVFVTEGEIDALTLCEMGYRAVALGGLKYSLVIDALRVIPAETRPVLVLALDNDEAGQSTQKSLAHDLRAESVPFKALLSVGKYHPLYGKAKDANEAYTAEKEAFIRRAEATMEDYSEIKPLGQRLARIADKLRAYTNVVEIETEGIAKAFPRGGFTNGLYVLGASPGMGKSALCQQIAEEVARKGHKVLYFSFEMGEEELLTRALVRSIASPLEKVENAFFAGDIGLEESIAENFFIEDFDRKAPTLETVQAVFSQFMQMNHDKTPLVVVDYLQLIQLADKRENADTVTRLQTLALELRKLSRLCPFLVISSLNRESQKMDDVQLTAFNGSGAIEYTANWAGVLCKGDGDTPPPKGTKRVILRVLKLRSGKATSPRLLFVGSQFKFINCDEPLKKPKATPPPPKKTAFAWN